MYIDYSSLPRFKQYKSHYEDKNTGKSFEKNNNKRTEF